MSGTTFDLGQFTQVSSAVEKALPQALAGLDPKKVINSLEGKGEQLEGLLHGIFETMLTPPSVTEEAKIEPTIIELGEFTANYGETIAEKLAGNDDPKRISWHNRDWATDEKFPDVRTGKKRYKASAVCFRKAMPDEDVAGWCVDNKKVRATPKEGIGLALVSPRPKLDNVMPLALAGQFLVGAGGDRDALYFHRNGDKRHLNNVWLRMDVQWSDDCWFLVLEELPSGT